MNIYVGHSSGFDYQRNLYKPLKDSLLTEEHNIVLPHETEDLFDSRSFLEGRCELFIAEVSEASTGLGIELGWADLLDVEILLISREDAEVSGSLEALSASHLRYTESEDIPEIIESEIENLR